VRILLTTCGSPHSRLTLGFGIQIARRASTPPTILTVIRGEADRPQANAILDKACSLFQHEATEVRTRVRVGPPAREIIREIEESHYDLVVVGQAQNNNSLTRLLLGSTAVRVVEHAPCPVIVAKGKSDPIRRILLCDSGATGPSTLKRFTTQLGGLLQGDEEVAVLHVMSQMSAGPGIDGHQLRASAGQLIEEDAPEAEFIRKSVEILKQSGIHPRPEVRHGLVINEILEEARTGDYDLVVIGAYRGEGWRRILLDDLAHKIIIQVDRPILVVR
jgi:nucleotide-binding universal stress UspA family protein